MIRALALLLVPALAGAAQFHVPASVPPRPVPRESDGLTLRLGGGAAAISAPGMALSGPGGWWELASRGADGGVGVSVRGAGFGLSGMFDPFGAGKRRTLGMAGLLAIDALWGEDESLVYHAGAAANLTVLDVRDPLPIGATGRLEPDTAVSLVPSFPVGAVFSRKSASGWLGEAQADAALSPGGETFFTYGPGGPPGGGRDATRPIHLEVSAGTRLRAAYEPWKLSLELSGRVSPGLGNNEPAAWGAVLLSLGAF